MAAGLAFFLAGCSGEKAKSAASRVTEKTVELTKGTFTGIDEGIDKGRKATQSADGALLVSTKEEFAKCVGVEILAVVPGQAKGEVEVQVGFANSGPVPVRIIDLAAKRNIILLDKDGYVCESHRLPDEVTIPEKAKLKVRLAFSCENGKAGKIRFFGTEFDIPPDSIADPKPAPAGNDSKPEAADAARNEPLKIEIPAGLVTVTDAQAQLVARSKALSRGMTLQEVKQQLGLPKVEKPDQLFYVLDENRVYGGNYVTAKLSFDNGGLSGITLGFGHESRRLINAP